MNEASMVSKRLSGQVAVVTGGSSGIGRASCLALAREGAHVVVVDIDQGRIEETARAIEQAGGPADSLGLSLDVTRESDMQAMASRTLERHGRIDILVASAGILRGRGALPKPMVDVSPDEWDQVLDTNLKGVFLSNRAVLPAMIRQRRGNIVNISSMAGKQGKAHDSAYCASKFGVIGLTESVAEEGRQYGVRVQVILPDVVDTPIWLQNGPIRPEQALSAERVADLILYIITLPEDTIMQGCMISPFRTRRRRRPAGPGESGAKELQDSSRREAPPVEEGTR